MAPSRGREGRSGGPAAGAVTLVLAAAVFVRMAVSLNPYSGEGNPPIFGDYEAQRHWMEITYHLPISEWYVNSSLNDLHYWGLDYPPLTAYHSRLTGAVAHSINPDWVALQSSRGFEGAEHKLFMRHSVLAVDVVVFFTGAVVYSWLLFPSGGALDQTVLLLLLLLQPALVLIDHGHFQYNSASLGLALWAIIAVVKDFDLLGSIAFCLALNYKQMELYHALPFFCFLLGKALRSGRPITKVVSLGVVVCVTFVLCWLPFLMSADHALQVVRRLFPFDRGLYEDKVANVWCTIAVVVKLRQLFSSSALAVLSLVSTLLALLPSSLDLLLHPSPYRFLLALANSSLAFFLFSFQVHEKSILLAALPVSLLTPHLPLPSTWFALVAAFIMYPLLQRDGLAVSCWALCGLFCSCSHLLLLGNQRPSWRKHVAFVASMAALLLLCLSSHLLPPPPHLPHLHTVLQSAFACAHFVGFLGVFTWLQLTAEPLKVSHAIGAAVWGDVIKTHEE